MNATKWLLNIVVRIRQQELFFQGSLLPQHPLRRGIHKGGKTRRRRSGGMKKPTQHILGVIKNGLKIVDGYVSHVMEI